MSSSGDDSDSDRQYFNKNNKKPIETKTDAKEDKKDDNKSETKRAIKKEHHRSKQLDEKQDHLDTPGSAKKPHGKKRSGSSSHLKKGHGHSKKKWKQRAT